MRTITAAIFGGMFFISWLNGSRPTDVLIEVFMMICSALICSWSLEHVRQLDKLSRGKE